MNLRFDDNGSQRDLTPMVYREDIGKHIGGEFENVYTQLDFRRDKCAEVIISCSTRFFYKKVVYEKVVLEWPKP